MSTVFAAGAQREAEAQEAAERLRDEMQKNEVEAARFALSICAPNDSEPDDSVIIAELAAEGLGDALVIHESMTRADLAVNVDRLLAWQAAKEDRVMELIEIRDRRVAMVREPFDAQIESQKRAAAWIGLKLTQMALAFPYPPKSKTMKLAFGEIGKRTQKPLLVVEDEATVIAFARVNVPEAVEDRPKLLKEKLNDWWVSTGEQVIPGCTIVAGFDKPFSKTYAPKAKRAKG